MNWEIDGKPVEIEERWYSGLKDVQGTFSGFLEQDVDLYDFSDATVLYIYAPKNLNRFRHWIALARERWFGVPYPTEVIYSGTIDRTETTENPDGSTTVTGTFTREGAFELEVKDD